MIYADSSALVKRYLDEPFSADRIQATAAPGFTVHRFY